MNAPVKIDTIEARRAEAPEWSISPSPFDWQVMIFGGRNPRNGFEWLPLEFQFFAKHYTRAQIEQRAADMAEYHKRDCFIIREPGAVIPKLEPLFVKVADVSDEKLFPNIAAALRARVEESRP